MSNSIFLFRQAIKRLIKRDHLTEEQALQRIDAQPDNQTLVSHSNVVISTQWSYEFSQQQVSDISPFFKMHKAIISNIRSHYPYLQADRAWRGLMEHLEKNRRT